MGKRKRILDIEVVEKHPNPRRKERSQHVLSKKINSMSNKKEDQYFRYALPSIQSRNGRVLY